MFTFHNFQARVVHLPGMEDEPSITFENFNLLMEKLGLSSQDEQDGEEEVATEDWGTEKGGIESGDKVEKRTKTTWRERDSERLREDLAKKEETSSASGSWREERSKVTPDIGKCRGTNTCMYVCMYVCMYIRTYVRMYVLYGFYIPYMNHSVNILF